MCFKDLELVCYALDDTTASMNIFIFIQGLTKQMYIFLVKVKA